MFKSFLCILFLIFITHTYADNKIEIIKNLEKTDNLNFNFEQNIKGKIENGNCTIEYPKKIFCNYKKNNGKILVSDGKLLVIKTRASFYQYPLKKTPFNFILDKEFLIDKIYKLDEKTIDQSYINYKIVENGNEIDIFFNNQTFDLIGWQTKDIYQNQSITLISSIKINRIIDKNLFKLPLQN